MRTNFFLKLLLGLFVLGTGLIPHGHQYHDSKYHSSHLLLYTKEPESTDIRELSDVHKHQTILVRPLPHRQKDSEADHSIELQLRTIDGNYITLDSH